MRLAVRLLILTVAVIFLIYPFIGRLNRGVDQRKFVGKVKKKTAEFIENDILEIKTKTADIDIKYDSGFINNDTERIAVLIIACDREKALEEIIKKVLKFRRDSFKFPIIVSQDCDHGPTGRVAVSFRKDVEYVKHVHESFMRINKFHRRYYSVAAHYKKALDFVFIRKNYSTIIVLEDDLEISPDIFEYFPATLPILRKDPTLWCVTAWNDNGFPELINQSDSSLLYRTDFFGGLGWMIQRSFWDEISSIWPKSYWDDWLRTPEQRKNRSCIRPEVGRTGMTKFGSEGVSRGMYFDKYLSKIVTNAEFVDFGQLNLDYLIKNNYDTKYFELVYNKSREFVNWQQFLNFSNSHEKEVFRARLKYESFTKFVEDNELNLMPDIKSGVPRTAYHGIVTFLHQNRRVFLVPSTTVPV